MESLVTNLDQAIHIVIHLKFKHLLQISLILPREVVEVMSKLILLHLMIHQSHMILLVIVTLMLLINIHLGIHRNKVRENHFIIIHLGYHKISLMLGMSGYHSQPNRMVNILQLSKEFILINHLRKDIVSLLIYIFKVLNLQSEIDLKECMKKARTVCNFKLNFHYVINCNFYSIILHLWKNFIKSWVKFMFLYYLKVHYFKCLIVFIFALIIDFLCLI